MVRIRNGLLCITFLLALTASPVHAKPGSSSDRLALEDRYQALQRQEMVLESSWDALSARGQTSAELLRMARSQDASRGLPEALMAQKEFQDRYDDHVKSELRYLLDEATFSAKSSLQELNGRITPVDLTRLTELEAKLQADAGEYIEREALYGTGKDIQRKMAYERFLKTFEEFRGAIEKLDAAPDAGRTPATRGLLAGLRSRLGALAERIRVALAMALRVPAVMKAIVFPERTTKPGELAFPKSLNRALREYAHSVGTTVSIAGSENLPKPSQVAEAPRRVNIIVPTHRSASLNMDAAVMAHVAPDDSLIFMAARNFLPGPLARLGDSNPFIISVGGGAPDPVEKSIQALKKGQSRNIFIYPEGGVPTKLEETLPIRVGFDEKLLERIEKEGFEVNLVPITYLDSGQIAEEARTAGSGVRLHAVVHPPIGSSELRALRAAAPGGVSTYLRSLWMENLPSDASRFLGLIRSQAAIARILRPETLPCENLYRGMRPRSAVAGSIGE